MTVLDIERCYRVSTEDSEEGLVYRQSRWEGNCTFEHWNVPDQKWERSEFACAAFVGFESSRVITEEEAIQIIAKQNREAEERMKAGKI